MFTKYEVRVYADRTEWLNEQGQLHRTNGPAYERANGTKAWYLNGQRHRTDGPAIEDTDGTKAWYLNGQLHRTDGPAVEWANGDKEWYLNGQSLSEKEFLAKTKASPCAGKIVEIDGKKYKLTEV